MNIRAADEAEIPAMAGIYGHHVLTGFGSFEETPTSPAVMAGRIAAVRGLDLPWLVAEEDGEILGYAYASAFRPRPGYRYTAEDSVYVAPEVVGRGVGRALLAAVVARCEAMGLRRMLAVIGDSANAASIGLHRALGFELVGVARGVGFKHGRWVDLVWMQRALHEGDQAPPSGAGLPLFEA